MSPSCCGNSRSRAALTLLELVVVLGILAALSTVAIRSLEPIADQARYEQTQSSMDSTKSAVIGYSTLQVDRPFVQVGFVADTGTLPAASTELLAKPTSLVQRTLYSFDSDRDATNDVNLTSGWNGPYVNLSAGKEDFLDGWGRDLSFNVSSGNLQIVSLGSDGDSIAPEERYAADITVNVTTKEYLGSLVLRIFAIDTVTGSRIDPNPLGITLPGPLPIGTVKLGVQYYGVNAAGGSNGAIQEQTIIFSNTGSFELRRDNTVIGTTAVRAVLWHDVDSDNSLDSGETIFSKSIVLYPIVQPGIDTRVELELR